MNHQCIIKTVLSLSLLMLSPMANAEICLPDIISDHMVLQQETHVRLWGWANPGETVVIYPEWHSSYHVSSDSLGFWEVSVPTPAASYTPYSITVSDSQSKITISDVLIGEVWLCSGQSNMQMPLKGFPWQPVEGSLEAITGAGNYPQIRMANVGHRRSYEPQETVDGKWLESNPENAAEFSAVGYFFARRLNETLHVPVGIINCSYGGSKVEGWLPKWKLDEYPGFDVEKERLTPDSVLRGWDRINVMYNAMLHPLTRYTIKGFAWNQGEANVGHYKEYAAHLADMVRIWRDEWGLGDLPFYSVEIPAWHYNNPDGTSAALLREAQHEAMSLIPNSGIISTVDLIYPSEFNDIHGSKKKEIGDRIAFMALSRTYNRKGFPDAYPEFREAEINGDSVIVRFDHISHGMTPHSSIEGFELAGSDRKFHKASAHADRNSNTIIIHCDSVKEIKSIRYCFRNFAIGKLHSTQGLPLPPFRTDRWDE